MATRARPRPRAAGGVDARWGARGGESAGESGGETGGEGSGDGALRTTLATCTATCGRARLGVISTRPSTLVSTYR